MCGFDVIPQFVQHITSVEAKRKGCVYNPIFIKNPKIVNKLI
jgi:hypothetical protein